MTPTTLKKSLKVENIVFCIYTRMPLHGNFQLYLHLENLSRLISDKRIMALRYLGESIIYEGGFIGIGGGQLWWLLM